MTTRFLDALLAATLGSLAVTGYMLEQSLHVVWHAENVIETTWRRQ